MGPEHVHRLAVADVLQPDLGGEDAGVVGAVLLERRIDLGENLGRLTGDVLGEVIGGEAGEEDEAMLLDGGGQDLVGAAALDV